MQVHLRHKNAWRHAEYTGWRGRCGESGVHRCLLTPFFHVCYWIFWRFVQLHPSFLPRPTPASLMTWMPPASCAGRGTQTLNETEAVEETSTAAA